MSLQPGRQRFLIPFQGFGIAIENARRAPSSAALFQGGFTRRQRPGIAPCDVVGQAQGLYLSAAGKG